MSFIILIHLSVERIFMQKSREEERLELHTGRKTSYGRISAFILLWKPGSSKSIFKTMSGIFRRERTMNDTIVAFAAGFILDLIFGESTMALPSCLFYWKYHCISGKKDSENFSENGKRRAFWRRPGGAADLSFSWGIPFLILYGVRQVCLPVAFLLETFWCYQLLATKSLKTESMKVYAALKTKSLSDARYAFSMIVGRDTQELSEKRGDKGGCGNDSRKCVRRNHCSYVLYGLGGVPLMFLSHKRNRYYGFYAWL